MAADFEKQMKRRRKRQEFWHNPPGGGSGETGAMIVDKFSGGWRKRMICALSALLLALVFPVYADDEISDYRDGIERFIAAVEADDPRRVAESFSFPIVRDSPVPSVDTPAEFVERYDQLFDEKLKRMIAESDVEADWEEVGWRGVMLDNGVLWIQSDGKINRLNYQTKSERLYRERLIEEDRQSLHETLRAFKEPELEWETARFRIRVDRLEDGSYRYAAWPAGTSTDQMPDLVLSAGDLEYEGSGGNHYFRFVNGDYEYRCDVIVLGTEGSPAGYLTVSRAGEQLLREPAEKVLK